MITDTERLIDGFRGVPLGMDGSKDPSMTADGAMWYATNVTFRGGGGPRSRPGFREISAAFWRNPQPTRYVTSIVVIDGVATATTTANHGYDNKDKVTIVGATSSSPATSVASINGTHVVTVVAANKFTFPTTVSDISISGSSQNNTTTISARRDIDDYYDVDFVDSTTSRQRYQTNIFSSSNVQGATIYQDGRDGFPELMVVAVDGKILTLNFGDSSCYLLHSGMAAGLPVYMTQVEKYLVIQNGQDEPRVFDGGQVQLASAFATYTGQKVVPTGRHMAYGQGRLFVSVSDGRQITASDLVFGGSTTESEIVSSGPGNPSVITTKSDHGFMQEDLVTITGHSSTPQINSTYRVLTVPSPKSFTIPVAITSPGNGGYVTRFNAGRDSDALRFTENTFLNEGGSFTVPEKFGKITSLAFLPVQDTVTGQGDLIAFCERGALTFQVSTPRDQWKNTAGFQRVIFDNIGSTGEAIPVNGDLFFRSKEGNGIRTYRNARMQSNDYGQTPVSAEIDPVLRQDTLWMLDQVSMAYFDNRLLMTCLPQQFPRRAANQNQADQYAEEAIPTLYNGIAVLDFQSTSAGRGKSSAVFDGVWTGLRINKLVQGVFDGEPRCFALCMDNDRATRIWEITTDDEFDTSASGRQRISSSVVTRGFNFGEANSLKKVIRCDLWFDDLGGGDDYPFECQLAFRPDDYPNFTTWQTFEKRFKTEFNIPAYSTVPSSPFNLERGYSPQNRVPAPPLTANLVTDVPAYLGYDFTLRIKWTGRGRIGRLMLHGNRLTESVGGASTLTTGLQTIPTTDISIV